MSTLYGNDKALKAAGGKEYIPGEVFALVTWKQQNDPSWFGAKIPADIKMVEFIRVMPPKTGHSSNIVYGKLEGKNLVPNPDTTLRQQRINYILAQKPSVMP